MQKVIKQIKDLESVKTLSKNERIVDGILNAINEGILKQNDTLPSVNTMINELGYARQTIAKAYKELVHTGVIESKNRVGYFVATIKSDQTLKVALVLYAFDIFQETLYENFRNGLGENVQLDIYFHHCNIQTFKSIIESIKGKYGMYVIAPIPHLKTEAILKKLPNNRLLLIDRYIETEEDYSYLAQEFKDSSYNAFVELKDQIKKYDKLVFYFKLSSAEPQEILDSFKKFIKDYDIDGIIEESYKPGSLEKGKAYFTINNLELWAMLKDSKVKGLRIGKDVGFISHNDDIVKEIIFNGVTTFSTDFAAMGKEAAEFVMQNKNQKVKKIFPTVLINRNSI